MAGPEDEMKSTFNYTRHSTQRSARKVWRGVFYAAALGLGLAPLSARAAEKTWDGSQSSDWFDGRNWTPQGVPGLNDTALVKGGRAITLSGRDTSVASLLLAGTSIDNGTLRSLSATTWTGGVVSCRLIASGRLDISGSADKSISDSDSVVNEGFASWSTPSDGAGRILMGTNSRFVNSAPATFAMGTDGTVFVIATGKAGAAINNAGAFLKSGGAGTTRLIGSSGVTFNQEGSLRANSGVLLLNGTLNFNQPSDITGAGLVRLGGTINLNRLLTIHVPVELAGGTLNGNALGSLAGTDSPLLRWTGGSMSGVVNITSSVPIEVSGSGTKYLLADCAINNASQFYWGTPAEGAGRILLKRRARFNNGAGAAFNATTDGTIFGFDDTTGDSLRAVFNNAGLFAKTGGAGTTTFSANAFADMANSGAVGANSGALAFGSRLDLDEGARIVGAGTLRMTAGRTFVNAATPLGSVFETAGGILSGKAAGSLNNAGGSLRWLNGTVEGTLNLGAGLPFEISGLADKSLAQGAVINSGGSATWSTPADGAGRILMARNSAFNILAGGAFTAASGGNVFRFSEPLLASEAFAANVSNAGLLALAPAGGARRFEGNINFSNLGALSLGTGLLSVPRFANGPAGTVAITVGGDAAGTTQGALVVGGKAILAGNLSISLAPGFVPASGSAFNVVTYGVREGAFGSASGLDLGGGRSLAPSYEANALRLTARSLPIGSTITPSRGFVGDTVTLSGLNLADASAVLFSGLAGGVPGSIVGRAAGSLQVLVPLGARSGAVSVQNPSGTTALVAFYVLPRLLSLSARSGLPGSTLVLGGTGFTGGSTPVVRFGAVPARITSISAQGDRIEVIVPEAASTGFVSVATGIGVASSPYAFTLLPQIVSFTPASAVPGSRISITGRGLVGVRAVYFGVAPALFSAISPTLVQAFVPAGARSGRITILTSGGAARSETDFHPAPRLLAFAPSAGIAGSVIAISGAGLSEVTSVRIGEVSMPFSRISDTSLRAVVPANAVSGRLSVATLGGTALSATAFTVLPSITSFSPTSGPVGTTVTIQGSGLSDVRSASINGRAAAFTRLSANALSIVIPTGATSGRIVLTTAAGSVTSAGTFTVASAPAA